MLWAEKNCELTGCPLSNLCYTVKCMNNYHHIWLKWAKMFHLWGVDRLGYLVLSELGSLNVFLAQALYLLQPFLTSDKASENYYALCALLEDDQNREAFLYLLNEQGRSSG